MRYARLYDLRDLGFRRYTSLEAGSVLIWEMSNLTTDVDITNKKKKA